MKITSIAFLACITAICLNANAKSIAKLTSAETLIENLPETLASAKKETDLTLLFPLILPKNDNVAEYFVYADFSGASHGINYRINIDSTKDCHGVHVCNLGYISASKNSEPDVFYDMKKKKLTKPVMLAQNKKGYFTPGHAMGSYFPATIQWQNNGILYTISWDTDQANLVKVANSAIENELK
ncbi:MAG: hypothetical protein P4M12_04050 [Gammaproteobacteria bacterium]|nr:hypothetical protein [Gammaproteobacteria bacterium]